MKRPIWGAAVLLLLLLTPGLGSDDGISSSIHFLDAAFSAAPSHSRPLFKNETSEHKVAILSLLRFYQVVISSQDRATCAFTLSCSAFATQAIRRYGVLAGILMASDRLQRCNSLASRYYQVDTINRHMIDLPIGFYYLGSRPSVKPLAFIPPFSSR